MKILITGSNGLIGGEAVQYFGERGHEVIGVDNNMRRLFFGEAGDTRWNERRLQSQGFYRVHDIDIQDDKGINALFINEGGFDAVIHCAAQPSHDKAKEFPRLDFGVNAVGTLNMLEATRQYSPKATFIFMSTNKVYGDAPNELGFEEWPTRFDLGRDWKGFDENTRIDQSTHSVFGASKVAADIMVQEYGRYFQLKTTVFRGGCLTGPMHSAVELHGFLSYLGKCVMSGKPYTVFGYGGKQVRDNIHSYDVIRAMDAVIQGPAKYGAVYNMGGGRQNSCSMIEAIDLFEGIIGKKLNCTYNPTARVGDHICYISDLTKFRSAYPAWDITKSLFRIAVEIVEGPKEKS